MIERNDIGSKEWQRRNTKWTFAGVMTWWPPVIGIFFFDDWWKITSAVMIAVGIWRSRPGWRRLVGIVWLLAMLIFGRGYEAATDGRGILPLPVFLFWLVGMACTWWADGQEHKKAREGGRGWE
jgi:hypothetical protein